MWDHTNRPALCLALVQMFNVTIWLHNSYYTQTKHGGKPRAWPLAISECDLLGPLGYIELQSVHIYIERLGVA
jgi:hypothetical protein